MLRRYTVAVAAVFLTSGAVTAHAGTVAGGIDLLELHPAADNTHLALESTFTTGTGARQFALRVDGGSDTRVAFEQAQVQALWMPQVSGSVTFGLGVRHDIRAGRNLTHPVAGVEVQLLPWLAGEHYVFLYEQGRVTGAARLNARLTLEPRVQFAWAAKALPGEDLAAGLTDLQASIRLRHRLNRHVDIYAGVIHEALLGGTADIARAAGDPARVTRAVIGAGFRL